MSEEFEIDKGKEDVGGTSAQLTRRNLAVAGAVVLAAMTMKARTSWAARHAGVLPPRHGHGGGGGSKYSPSSGGSTYQCFLSGTSLLTPSGEIEIDRLQAGDRVVTHSGSHGTIRRVVSTSFERGTDGTWSEGALPVIVERGALAENVPHSDLKISSLHCLFFDGVLIPVKDLVNGKSIRYAEASETDRLDYYHVELEGHDVVFANGVACESLLSEGAPAYAPVLSYPGGRAVLASRLRSALSSIVDFRDRKDVIRDRLEDRAEWLHAA